MIFIQLLSVLAFFIISAFCTNDQTNFWNPSKTPYPTFKQVSKTYSFASAKLGNNVTIPDPFHWLEGSIESDQDVQDFIAKQTELTESYMANCGKDLQKINESIRNAYEYDNYQFYYVNGSGNSIFAYSLVRANEERSTWYMASNEEIEKARKTNFQEPPGKKFLDETLLSENGTAAIEYAEFSFDGKYFAYLVSEESNDLITWYFRLTESALIEAKTRPEGGEGRLPESIPFAAGGLLWTKDSKGFYYSQVEDPKGGTNSEIGSRVRFHEMGTNSNDDITIVHPANDSITGKQNRWKIDLSNDDQWLIVVGKVDDSGRSTAYATYLPAQNLSQGPFSWISISPSHEFTHDSLDVIEDTWYFITNRDAIDSKVSKTKLDFSKAKQVKDLGELKDQIEFQDVIPQKPFTELQDGAIFDHDKLMLAYVENGKYVVYLFKLFTGQLIQKLFTKESLMLGGVFFNSRNSTKALFTFQDLTSPSKVFEMEIKEDNTIEETLFSVQNVKGTNSLDFTTEELFAKSKDGTLIPYTIVYKKGTPKDGTRPAWVHFQGAFGYLESNYWYPGNFAWLNDYGGFFVWASPRGGGERGQEWHQAATKQNKHKTFEDIIAIAQDLVKRKITSPELLIGEGDTAGGLAALAVANEGKPNTFAIMFPIRAQCDIFFTQRTRIASYTYAEFGNVENATEFDYIYSYSPQQNIQTNKTYPGLLFTPGATDDRIFPSQSFKFLAQIQKSNPTNPNPFLMHLVNDAGHVIEYSATSTAIEEEIHHHCFAQLALDLKRLD